MRDDFTPEGAPIPSGIPRNRERSNNRLMKGYVQRAVYEDDPDNVTGMLEYIVAIGGQDFYGVRDMEDMGGIFNSHIKVRKGAESSNSPAKPNPIVNVDPTYDETKDGEQVWCMFIGGNKDVPIIVGSAQHVRSPINPDAPKPSAALGVYERREFNGLEWMTDKDGNFQLKIVNKKKIPNGTDNVTPEDSSLVPYKGSFYKIHNDGKIEIDLNPSTKILIDPVGNVVSVVNGAGTTFVIDGENDALSVTAKFGDTLSVSAADGIQASTPSGTSLSMKGGIIQVDGTGGKLKLADGKVGIGGSTTELLQQVSDSLAQLSALCTQLDAEVHTGNLGYPTSPPTVQYVPTVGAAVDAIKVLVDGIKGGL